MVTPATTIVYAERDVYDLTTGDPLGGGPSCPVCGGLLAWGKHESCGIHLAVVTDAAIDTAARKLSAGSWGSLGGGFLLFDADDLSGGAWYSHGSRPTTAGCIKVPVPSRSVSFAEAKEIVLAALGLEV